MNIKLDLSSGTVLNFTLIESNFLHPSVAVSNMGNPNISLCKCIDTSPRSSSGKSCKICQFCKLFNGYISNWDRL